MDEDHQRRRINLQQRHLRLERSRQANTDCAGAAMRLRSSWLAKSEHQRRAIGMFTLPKQTEGRATSLTKTDGCERRLRVPRL